MSHPGFQTPKIIYVFFLKRNTHLKQKYSLRLNSIAEFQTGTTKKFWRAQLILFRERGKARNNGNDSILSNATLFLTFPFQLFGRPRSSAESDFCERTEEIQTKRVTSFLSLGVYLNRLLSRFICGAERKI